MTSNIMKECATNIMKECETSRVTYDDNLLIGKEVDKSEIDFALTSLDDRLNHIQELKNVLRERLCPVLNSYKDECGGDNNQKGDPVSGIPLVNSIMNYTSLAGDIVDDLEDIISRLGI